MRHFLKPPARRRARRHQQGWRMFFLNSTDEDAIKVLRKGMPSNGVIASQRLGMPRSCAQATGLDKEQMRIRRPQWAGRRAGAASDPFLQQTAARQPAQQDGTRPARRRPIPKQVPILRNPAKTTDESDAVFYFPGCGSERLFSQVGLATLAWML
jgi:hypothetical protein